GPATPRAPAAPAKGVPQPGGVLDQLVASHGGVAAAGPAACDTLTATFTTAAEAVACALDLQRAPLPVRLAVCLCTQEIRSTDGNGDRRSRLPGQAPRLLDVTHSGQTVLTGITGDLVSGSLPEEAWLADLGSHRLADLGRAERVWQL